MNKGESGNMEHMGNNLYIGYLLSRKSNIYNEDVECLKFFVCWGCKGGRSVNWGG